MIYCNFRSRNVAMINQSKFIDCTTTSTTVTLNLTHSATPIPTHITHAILDGGFLGTEI